MNKKYEKEKQEHQKCMKTKEKEKEKQMEEQTKKKESPTKKVTAVSSVTVRTERGHVTTVEQVANVTKGDESETAQKADDELRKMQVVQAEVHRNPDPGDTENVEMGKSEDEGETTPQETSEEDQPVIEFKNKAYELAQAYQLEPEYYEMTEEQEAEAVQVLTPREQVKYQELAKFHQRQAETEKEIKGLSQLIKERTNAKAPGLLVDLIQRSVKTEAPEKQELYELMEAQCTKQGEIPRTERPRTRRGYYLFVEDDLGCLIEQEDEEGNVRYVKDIDTDQILPTDQITEAKAETYQIPEEDQQEDDVETISSTSMAVYDQKEVETSLTTIADAFHTISQEYEKLVGVVPHMSTVQAANVITRMPILPFLMQEAKVENKQELTGKKLGNLSQVHLMSNLQCRKIQDLHSHQLRR